MRQMKLAREHGANVAHFPETCLGGYAGVDFDSFENYNWDLLLHSTEKIMALAHDLKLWVILGSNHRLSGDHKPHNSLYVIDDSGTIIDRYDKMFCTGNKEETSGDLKHYSPGSHFVIFTLKGIGCGLQICHDMRYPELYREYARRGVQIMFHSYYNGKRKFKNPCDPDENIWGIITEPTMQTYAAENYMWISANNTTTRESCWPSFFVRPDGVITGRLKRNKKSMLISVVDTKYSYYDASKEWRDRAMNGIYHSGNPVPDKRSDDRTSL
jgi:predicted amidohydrolase